MSINNPYSLSWGWKVDPDNRQDRSCSPVTTRKMTDEEMKKYGIAEKIEVEEDMKNKLDVDVNRMIEICREHGTGKEGVKEVAKELHLTDKQAENQIFLKKIRRTLQEEPEMKAQEHVDDTTKEIAEVAKEAVDVEARAAMEKISLANEVDEMLEMVPEDDSINHPKHYTTGNIEVMDFIQDKLTPEEFEGFCKGVILQYVCRCRFKGGLEDLRKAQWYLDRVIKAKETA